MATYSSNTTTKFTGTQVTQTRTTTGTLYTVPSGKTFVGCFYLDSLNPAFASLSIDGTTVAATNNTLAGYVTGPLYVNAGSVIASTNTSGGRVSVFGVLMENTP